MTPLDDRLLLLDVGGTFIKCSDGREVAVDSNGSRESISTSLKEAVLGGSFIPERVAVAIPGPFNYGEGVFMMKHKFAAVYGDKFADLVGTDAEYRFVHDANSMLLGEVYFGEGKGFSNVALVTLGTGLGFSMFVDGALKNNEAGSPAVPIYKLPFRDGMLEDYVSKRGFLRGYEGITVKELADKARNGDESAKLRFLECGTILADTIAPLLREHGIECLLFGGQISRSFSLLEPSVGILKGQVPSLKKISIISSFEEGTFNGLKSLF